MTIVLGIESTCDETACSIVEAGEKILGEAVSSQIDLHQIFGGVVPELACRRHMEVIVPVIQEALKKSGVSLQDIQLIAVAYGPGLVGPLFVGLQAAKGLAYALNIPIVGVHHVEAHLYAALMGKEAAPAFPALGVVLSGGHAHLLQVNHLGSYAMLGTNVDDALGEAFDKVAKLLGLPYPGGPPVEKLAKKGNPLAYPLKAGSCKGAPLNFSFSGLKTGVLYTFQKEESPDEAFKADLCASFQHAAFKDVISKIKLAKEQIGINCLIFGGGVTQNQTLRKLMEEEFPDSQLFWPLPALSMDNATMIAGLGYHVFKERGPSDLLTLEPKTRIPLS
jgi:N6-L-threonylcarbamoyladenine synthase